MKIEQHLWTKEKWWPHSGESHLQNSARLVFAFGATDTLKSYDLPGMVKKMYPGAHLFGCSTSGEILGTQVYDDTITVTAVTFDKTDFQGTALDLSRTKNSKEAGEKLAGMLPHEGLAHVFVLSDGLNVNGSDLVEGLSQSLPQQVTITGGLAGDGARFGETLVFWDSTPKVNYIVALGFYGTHIKIGYGSMGGWDPFGPERVITKSKENVLYELDDQSALDVYKKYLGTHAQGLPATGLLFPLSIRTRTGESGIVRTILSVNEAEHTMTFAGDVPEGAYARFMKANFERLIDGSHGAAKTSYAAIGSSSPELAILISCVGRKLVLKQRTEEEVEAARDVLGKDTVFTGFYSYGEISPFTPGAKCTLHNQTMTITTFSEA